MSTESVSFRFCPLATSTPIRSSQENGSIQEENFNELNNRFTNEITLSGASNSNGEMLYGQTPNNEPNMSVKTCEERFNRVTFFIKNVKTSRTYMDAFTSILSIYPLALVSANDKRKPVKYLCVAGNVLTGYAVSIGFEFDF